MFSFEHVRVHVYVMRAPYARVEFSSGITRACVRTCTYVRSRESTCVGSRALVGCCVYVSAARDASIARTHLERRRVFCSRTFQDVL